MKKSAITVVAIFSAVVACAQSRPIPQDILMKRVGGYIERPGAFHGKVLVVNAQTVVPSEAFTNTVETLGFVARALTDYVPSAQAPTPATAQGKVKELGGEAAVFIVNDPALPVAFLAAPENRWCFVNVAPLAADGAKSSFVTARARKELVRAYVTVCGAFGSSYNSPIMGVVNKPSDLDTIVDERVPQDVLGRTREYLPKIGVDTRRLATYLQACKEGWAPQPTNEFQKAVWDRIHKLPTKPLTITPEPAKPNTK